MRKLFLILLLLSLPCLAEARMTTVVVGGGVAAAGSSCAVADNEVGSRAEGSEAPLVVGYAWAYRAQADCSGTLETAYLNHLDTTASAAKVCIYNSTNANPTVGGASDTKVGCSGEITSSTTTGWKTGSIGAGSVTSGNYYWVVIAVSGGLDNWQGGTGSTGSLWYAEDANFSYASPPAVMGTAGWFDSGAYYPVAAYVRIQ